jgi:hypothetical protein
MRLRYHFGELPSTGIAVQRHKNVPVERENYTTLRSAIPLGVLGLLDGW